MLDLHYWPTPNGKKVTIQLEECGVPYNIVQCNIGKGDQFDSSFLEESRYLYLSLEPSCSTSQRRLGSLCPKI